MITIHCPLCQTEIPAPATGQPDSRGVTVILDSRLVDEHINMHQRCICQWENGILVHMEDTCDIHGLDTEDEETDPLFTDILTAE